MIELSEVRNLLDTRVEISHEDGPYIITEPLEIAVFNFLSEGVRLHDSMKKLSIGKEKIDLLIPNILK